MGSISELSSSSAARELLTPRTLPQMKFVFDQELRFRRSTDRASTGLIGPGVRVFRFAAFIFGIRSTDSESEFGPDRTVLALVF